MNGSFSANVSEWVKGATKNAAATQQRIILSLFRSVILSTPVGDPDLWQGSAPAGYVGGRLRGNWQISSNAPKTGEVEIIDPSGNKTVANVQQFLLNLDFTKDQKVFLANNLPYAYIIEFAGHSRQAPNGMVAMNVLRISENLKK